MIQPASVTTNATLIDSSPSIAIVGVSASGNGLQITNITVDGSLANLPACSGTGFAGIEFHDASGSLKKVHVTNTVPSAGITGCQVGNAIYVASNAPAPLRDLD